MRWKTICYVITILFKILACVSSEENELSCRNPIGYIFEWVNVTSFIDENRYIRLNISWDRPKANFTNFEMMIDTNCSSLYGERNILVDQKFVIEPNMERLKHPAEPLVHGCKYDFELYTEATFENQTCIISQVVDYEIPECVNEVCECGVADSPYEYKEISHIMDHLYEIKFYKTDINVDLNLEAVFYRVLYANINSNKTVTTIHPGEIQFDNDNNAFTVSFNDIHDGNSYIVYIDLILDNCEYQFTEKLHVPSAPTPEPTTRSYSKYSLFLFLLFVALGIYVFFKTKPELIEKLKRYLPFLPSLPELPTSTQEMAPVKIAREVINSQYTPLEFIVNAHKYDKYEFPRNKIILKNKIGGGAFGHVYKAEIYELDKKPGYTIAAAKKTIENAPQEEVADFLAEIETMKKIAENGGHTNVIKILACVTIESPHIMVMELVSCGSLKTYLSNLRQEWEQRKRRFHTQRHNQHFFPDDYTGHSISSGTNSYVTPDTPSTPDSPQSNPVTPKIYSKSSRMFKSKHSKICFAPKSPVSPDSLTSSGLPSVTETLLTPLGSEISTPFIDLTEEDKLKPVLDSKELQNFALQIANGMAFLESIEITHRDLAARNILINENKVLKISDFGMARLGVYVNTTQKKLPIRWMAPEAIENRRCDNKTDVWSFGVVLWEIGSLGAFPYKDLSDTLVMLHIPQGKILERPETCTDHVYELMKKCWQKNPEDRPRFEEIAKQLDISSGKIYVDFSKISPKYVFPPTQEGT